MDTHYSAHNKTTAAHIKAVSAEVEEAIKTGVFQSKRQKLEMNSSVRSNLMMMTLKSHVVNV